MKKNKVDVARRLFQKPFTEVSADIESPLHEGYVTTCIVRIHKSYSVQCPQCGRRGEILTIGMDTPEDREAVCWCPCGHRWVNA